MVRTVLAVWMVAWGLAAPVPALDAGCEQLYQRYADLPRRITGGAVTPGWMADGDRFWYAVETPGNTVIYLVDPQANTQEPLFDVERLRQALAAEVGYALPCRGLPFATFRFGPGEETVVFRFAESEYRLRLADYALTRLPAVSEAEQQRILPEVVRMPRYDGEQPVFEIPSPDGRWLTGLAGGNLVLRSTYDGHQRQLTNDAVTDVVWDMAVVRWSPDSLRLVAAHIDYRDVHRVPVLHWLQAEEQIAWLPLPKAGMRLPRIELYAIDVFSRRTVRLSDGGAEGDRFLFPVGWLGNGREFLVLRLSRDHRRLELLVADVYTGAARTVLSEISPTFIEGLRFHVVWPEIVTLLAGDRHFLWRSEREGRSQLYLYDLDGRLLRRLTSGAFPVERVVAVDEAGGWVYFTGRGDAQRPYDLHLYRVGLDGEGQRQLTEASGEHHVQLSPSRRFFLDHHSTVARPPRTELRSADGTLLRVLAEADASALVELDWQPPEEFVVKAADGRTELWGVLFKPRDFDPSRKYPLLDYVYNGPFTTWVPRTFLDSVAIEAHALAQLGFLVMVVDGRGTPYRGKEFQDVVYLNFGRHEVPDHVAALHQLAARHPAIDLDRVGIFGASWGGYMTIRAMLMAPEVYRAGVATNPVVDLYDHEATSIEGYMGLPQDHPQAYEQASNLPLAGQLQGHLLLVHATGDVNATFSATMKMVEAFIRADRPFDFLPLPEQTHVPRGASQRYWLKALRSYFVEHLQPGADPPGHP